MQRTGVPIKPYDIFAIKNIEHKANHYLNDSTHKHAMLETCHKNIIITVCIF